MPHNPYTPPAAQVDGVIEKTAYDFSSTIDYSFTPKQLWWAGVCCILGVLLAIPYLVMAVMVESMPALKSTLIVTLFVMTALSIYAYLTFKKLLSEKSGYRAANMGISLYIVASIITALTAPFTNSADSSMFTTVLSVAELIAFGGLAIYLGIKLLRCEDPLFGQIKLIAYLTLAMGITLASVILALLGVLISFALGIAMALMFLRASRALAMVQA